MKPTMDSSTWERYNEYHKHYDILTNRKQCEQYVVNLAEDIIDELKKRGECWLVKACLSDGLKPYWIDIVAVCMAFDRLVTDGGLNTRHTTVEIQRIYDIPSNRFLINDGTLPKKYRWVLLPLQWYGIAQCDKDKAVEQAQEFARLSEEIDALRKQRDELQASNATLRDELSNLKQTQAQREAQANEKMAVAAAQLEKIRENAEQLVAEKKEEILAEAQAERAKAHEDAVAIMRDNCDRVEKYAREARDELLKESTSEKLAKAHDEIRAEMCRQTQGMQRAMLEALTETSERLGALLTENQSDIAGKLNAWRNSLYEADYRSLASYYCNMYRFINGVIEKDLVLQKSEDGMNETPAVARMIKHQASLTRYLASLNRTLSALGMSFISPEAGELFDDYLHTTDTEDYVGEDATIESCTCPGIRLGVEGKVIIRAEVVLKAGTQCDQPKHEEGAGEE